MENVSVAEAKKHFSDLMAQVAYAGQRVVVERHGKPMMAWVSLDDLQKLEMPDNGDEEYRRAANAALRKSVSVRGQILEEREDEPLSDSAELLNVLREGRVDELSRGR